MRSTLLRAFAGALLCLCATAVVLTQDGVRQTNETYTDYYYFAGRRVPVQRSPTQAVVRLTADASSGGSARLRQLVPTASVGEEMAVNGRSYRILTMSSPASAAASTVDNLAFVRELSVSADVDFAAPLLQEPQSGAMLVPTDEIIAKALTGQSRATLEPLVERFGLTVDRSLRGSADEFILRVSPGADAVERARVLHESGLVAWAEPNFLQHYRRAAIPNDPIFASQWHLRNVGQGGGVPGADIGVEHAWDTERGNAGTVIAIIDDGIDLGHEDLAQNLFVNTREIPGNFYDDDQNGYVDDVRGWDFYSNDNDPGAGGTGDEHGTAVAGVAAARGDNGIGLTGACQRCSILPIKISSGDFFASSERIAEGIRYAATLADVINNSWGGGAPINAVASALQFAASSGRNGKGTVVLSAAGNSAGGNIGLVAEGLPAGTHRFRWTYSKNASLTGGDDAAWLAAVLFPGGELVHFDGQGLPANWTTGGDAPWSVVVDPLHADEGSCTLTSARSGAIGNSQTSYLEVIRSVPAGDLFLLQYVSSQSGDGLRAQIDLHNDGQFDLQSSVLSGLPPTGVMYPAAYPESLAVGASSNFDCRSHYSQFGTPLAFLAPGSAGFRNRGIFTTDRTGPAGYVPENYVEEFGGTSSATPLAAGVVGLLLSRNPSLTSAEVRQILTDSADRIGPVTYVNGRHERYGAGRLNAGVAVGSTPLRPDEPPVITVEPLDQLAPYNGSVRLSVRATGPALSYQWYAGARGDTSSPVAGATDPIFDTPNVLAPVSYWVRVSNPYGASDSRSAMLTPGAGFDPMLGVPRCLDVGASCDSGRLLVGRGIFGPEPNYPNALGGVCKDGTRATASGTGGIQRIKVTTVDGGDFETGKMVRVEVQSLPGTPLGTASVMLFFTGDASSPDWAQFAVTTPSSTAPHTFVATYQLPAGTMQAVRATLSYGSSLFASTCHVPPAGHEFQDHDDIVFAAREVPFAPVMVQNPQTSFSALFGTVWPLSVVAVGSSPMSYQWYRGAAGSTDDPVVGATSRVLNATVGPTPVTYWARAANALGTADSSAVVVSPVLEVSAVYDTARKAPRCAIGAACDSHSLLIGKEFTEVNRPNTIGGTCQDGRVGSSGFLDERINRVKVSRVDGQIMAPGRAVRIDVEMVVFSSVSNFLDLFYAPDADSPVWVHIATLRPDNRGAQNLSTTYILPFGSLQAVRARLRYQGSAVPCAPAGGAVYDDHDDLIFGVHSPATTLPGITSQPQSQLVQEGQTATLTVHAHGPGLSFQWFRGASGDTSNPIAGATASSYLTPPVFGRTDYWVRVLASSGTVDSAAAAVRGTVRTAAARHATLRVPACLAWTMSCDSMGLLTGRGPLGPEAGAPNTLGGVCLDGTSGVFHIDESIDGLRVSTVSGDPFTAGSTVRVDVSMWNFSHLSNRVDVYYAGNALSPSWTYLATLEPQSGGPQVLSATYVLPPGGLQAIRARMRYRSTPTPCGTGAYDDHDDLVFAVDGPSSLALPEPVVLSTADVTGAVPPFAAPAVWSGMAVETLAGGESPETIAGHRDTERSLALEEAAAEDMRASEIRAIEASHPEPGSVVNDRNVPLSTNAPTSDARAAFGAYRPFTLRYSSPRGVTGISYADAWFTATTVSSDVARTCVLYLERSSNALLLVSDDGTELLRGTIGASGMLSNQQCTVDLSSVKASGAGAELVVDLTVRFSRTYDVAGVYTRAVDANGVSSGWVLSSTASAGTGVAAPPNVPSTLVATSQEGQVQEQ